MTASAGYPFLDEMVAAANQAPVFAPHAFFNADGDCVEFIASDESYYAERVDSRLTVYYGQESGQPVGSLIKGIKSILERLNEACPGFCIEVEDGKVHLSHLFTAAMWIENDGKVPTRAVVYRKLRKIAEADNVEVELPQLARC
uniref:Uncharacterized protein n=1 Tax=Schlesneria paludicola TaxID=360056 RepID=A0A7C2JYG9_9PLAN